MDLPLGKSLCIRLSMKAYVQPLILLATSASLLGFSAHAASPDGNWLWTTAARTNGPVRESILSLKSEGSHLIGKISSPGADGKPTDTPISHGKWEGDFISFAVIRETSGSKVTNLYSAKVSGDKLVGKISFTRNGEERSREWEAKNNGDRSVATAVAAPKPGYNEQGYKIVNDTKFRELSPDEAEKHLREHPETIILDLRPPAAYAAGHIAGAKSLDVTDDATYREALKPLDKTKHYLVHSISGGYRTVRVFDYFQENGFEHAVAIKGGIQAWTAAGKPTVK